MSEDTIPIKSIDVEVLYDRDPKLKKEDLAALREWLKKQPHLPQVTDLQLLVVLHSCYYSLEESKVTLENYFSVKKLCPAIFKSMSKEDLKKTTSVAYVSVLPKWTPDGFAVIMTKLLDDRAENFHLANHVNLVNMIGIMEIFQRGVSKGAIAVFDMKGFGLGHVARLNLTIIKYALYYVQEAAPIRIKQVHVINAIPLADKILSLVKPFLKNELIQLLQFHPPNSESLYKWVPKECLPADYGGSQPSSAELNEKNVENLLENYELFPWHDNHQSDESKRIGKSKVDSNFGSIEGSFKKLEID